jgi:hypothetical protein
MIEFAPLCRWEDARLWGGAHRIGRRHAMHARPVRSAVDPAGRRMWGGGGSSLEWALLLEAFRLLLDRFLADGGEVVFVQTMAVGCRRGQEFIGRMMDRGQYPQFRSHIFSSLLTKMLSQFATLWFAFFPKVSLEMLQVHDRKSRPKTFYGARDILSDHMKKLERFDLENPALRRRHLHLRLNDFARSSIFYHLASFVYQKSDKKLVSSHLLISIYPSQNQLP